MKSFVAAAALACISLGTPAFAQHAQAIEAAKAGALAWLAINDAGQFGASWQAASRSLRGKVSQADWEQAVGMSRPPLGAVKRRVLKSAVYLTELPGAPKGEYVVIQYATDFQNKDQLTETVTPVREQDGSWKVSGYFIR